MRRQAEEEAERKRLEEEEREKAKAEAERAEAERKDAIAKKVAARKERIINFRDRMKDLKNEEEAKNLREQLYTLQLSFDEDEHGSSELMDFYNKTMDDIQHAGEIATLKAENAKSRSASSRRSPSASTAFPRRRRVQVLAAVVPAQDRVHVPERDRAAHVPQVRGRAVQDRAVHVPQVRGRAAHVLRPAQGVPRHVRPQSGNNSGIGANTITA